MNDYGALGTTNFGSIISDNITTNIYTDLALNNDGLNNISKTSISKFGLRTEWDRSGVFGGNWIVGPAYSKIYGNFADQTIFK